MPSETLRQRAEQLIQRFGSPWIIPEFKKRNLPGVWGARTDPIRAIEKPSGKTTLVYLAQQFPTMGIVLITENTYGERSILYNFHPKLFQITSRMNDHLELKGQITDRSSIDELLTYMEITYK